VDYGEADRILTLLTKDHGKVGAIAKGARRQPSRLGPALQVYHHRDAQLATGHNLDVVTQAVAIAGPRMPADIEWTARAAVICELADTVSEERHPEPDLFELTRDGLRELAEEAAPRRATARFLMQALLQLGYGPRLHECAGCDRPLPERPSAFSPEVGGFLCSDCARPGMPPVPVRAIKVLRVLEAGDVELYRRLKLSDELLTSIEDVLEAQLEYHLDRQLRSLRFLRQLRSAQPAPGVGRDG
jgi:DNA repair protein RecO (recombination protein O)